MKCFKHCPSVFSTSDETQPNDSLFFLTVCLSLHTVCRERWLMKASYGQLIVYRLCVVALWVFSNCCSSTLVHTCLWTSTPSLSPAAVTLVWLLRGYLCHFRPTSEAYWGLPPTEKSRGLGLLWCLFGRSWAWF